MDSELTILGWPARHIASMEAQTVKYFSESSLVSYAIFGNNSQHSCLDPSRSRAHHPDRFLQKASVTSKKKSLYEILAISPNASSAEIQAGYDTIFAKLQSLKERLGAEEFDFKAKVLNLALETLSNPSARHAYDAKLAASAGLRTPPAMAAAPNLSLIPVQSDAETLSLKAEAMALRADAMTLRADAMAIRSGASPFRESRNFSDERSGSAITSVVPVVRKVLVVLGTLFAIAIVVQVIALRSANRQSMVDAAVAEKAREKVELQEYYQQYGVRPANKAELELLKAENRRKEEAARKLADERERIEEDSRRFEENARRRGDQVSSALQMAELTAKEQARREDERKEWQKKEEQRVNEQIERNRIERQKAEWRDVMRH